MRPKLESQEKNNLKKASSIDSVLPMNELPAHGEAQYDSWAAYYEENRLTLPEIHRHLGNMAHFIRACEYFAPGKRFLEIGTGTGLKSIYFSQLGYEVTGMDYDQGILSLNQGLNDRFGGKAQFLGGDIFAFPLQENSFDLCFHQGLMEHFDPPQIIESLHAQVKISKRVVFSVPTIKWQGGVFGNERMMSGAKWLDILTPFRVLHVFGGAYGNLPARLLNFAGNRLTKYQPQFLFGPLALHFAGDLGFVIERK